MDATPREPWIARWGPLMLVGATVLFNLWVLKAERRLAWNSHDGPVHEAMIRQATDRFSEGDSPLGVWFPYLTTGFPMFHHYQSLPAVVTGLGSWALGVDHGYGLALYVFLASWPVSVYLGVRLLGWGRWTAAIAAVVSPLVASRPGLGLEFGSYTWGGGFGVWTQLWGTWMLPLACGTTWRAVTRRGPLWVAAVCLGLTIALHFLTGYLAFAAVGLWVLIRPSEALGRAVRVAVVWLFAILAVIWVLLPYLVDSVWDVGGSEISLAGFWKDSYGAGQVLSWLVTGQLLDAGRPPVLTVFMFVGLGVCVARWRRDERARAIAAFWAVSLLLFIGRPTFGGLLNLLPLGQNLQFNRFIVGVHLGGVVLTAVGAVWSFLALKPRAEALVRRWRLLRGPGRYQPVATGLLVLVFALVTIPGWLNRMHVQALSAEWIGQQRAVDLTDGADVAGLIDAARRRFDGRFYAGAPWNWGADYRIGAVPMYKVLLYEDADAIGYTFRTASFLTDVERRFDETRLAHYDLFGVRYLLLPSGKEPPVEASVLARRGRHVLWRVASTGYLKVVDSSGPPVRVERCCWGRQVHEFVQSAAVEQGVHPVLSYRDAAEPVVTAPFGEVGDADDRGVMEQERHDPTHGFFSGTVRLNRSAVVMLKASFHGRWRALLDGEPEPTYLIAPGYLAISVPEGVHRVAFRYEPFDGYGWLFLITAVSVGGLAAAERIVRWRRQRSAPRVPDDEPRVP